MKNLSGKDTVFKSFLISTVYAFPRCNCGIWRLIGRRDCYSISFSSSTESELHKDPASFNQFDVLVVVQRKAARCRIHLRPVMVRYGLGLVKVLRGVKALETGKKSANCFWKLTPARTSRAILKIFKINFVMLLLLLHNQLDVRQN